MNCWCSDSLSFAAKMRASGSTEPPGGYGDTNFTTRVGHSWACAPIANASKTKNRDRPRFLERHIARSLELQHIARVVRRRNGETELLQDAPRLRHLLRVRLRELAAAKPQAVFEAHAHV